MSTLALSVCEKNLRAGINWHVISVQGRSLWNWVDVIYTKPPYSRIIFCIVTCIIEIGCRMPSCSCFLVQHEDVARFIGWMFYPCNMGRKNMHAVRFVNIWKSPIQIDVCALGLRYTWALYSTKLKYLLKSIFWVVIKKSIQNRNVFEGDGCQHTREPMHFRNGISMALNLVKYVLKWNP